jgi:ribonuclease Z
MRRAIWWAVGVVLVLGALGTVILRMPSVEDALIRRVAARLVTATGDALFEPDALRVLLCGTSAPLPHETRAKACTAVFAAGRLWVVDTGPGAWNRIALSRIDGRRIGAVLFTHFHSDHIGDLGEFNLQTWAAGRPEPLRVFGPPGVERVVAGFAEAYALDTRYRILHHGADFLPEAAARMQAMPVTIPGGAVSLPILDHEGLRISAFPVDHRPIVPAYGYRFDYRGRSVVVSGDTAKTPSLVAAAEGADVLVHEAQANHLIAIVGEAASAAGRDRVAKIMADIPSYHTTPVEAAEQANAAHVRLLVLSHLNPPPPNRFAERPFVRGVAEVRPTGWILGDDGLLIELPADSDKVTTRHW